MTCAAVPPLDDFMSERCKCWETRRRTTGIPAMICIYLYYVYIYIYIISYKYIYILYKLQKLPVIYKRVRFEVPMLRYDGMVFNRGAFLAALGSDWSVDIKRVRSMGTCFCGGQGCLAAGECHS